MTEVMTATEIKIDGRHHCVVGAEPVGRPRLAVNPRGGDAEDLNFHCDLRDPRHVHLLAQLLAGAGDKGVSMWYRGDLDDDRFAFAVLFCGYNTGESLEETLRRVPMELHATGPAFDTVKEYLWPTFN